ncbi:MAG: (2Fe-2S)-binding protein [Armatimonadetes bacterium]|nr:(2Fe-2S)-binding protein [Armatimonadota bacterium]
MKIKFKINGKETQVEAPPAWTLLKILREKLNLTGTKEGCGRGECGSCTVLIDKKPVNACLVLAGQIQGKEILTIEGVACEKLHPLQNSFIEEGAVQCGFCTPGMIMSALALLNENKKPALLEIKQAISGNLCRCTGYQKIIKAIKKAALKLN